MHLLCIQVCVSQGGDERDVVWLDDDWLDGDRLMWANLTLLSERGRFVWIVVGMISCLKEV